MVVLLGAVVVVVGLGRSRWVDIVVVRAAAAVGGCGVFAKSGCHTSGAWLGQKQKLGKTYRQ